MRSHSLLALGLLAFATRPAAASDFDAPQSPPKPAPFPVKLVDQGGNDPRLKGLFAPEGFKVEVLADAPVVVNPVALTFAPDGTPFVAEWAVDSVTNSRWFEFKETVRYTDGSTRLVTTMRKFVPDPIKRLAGAAGSYTKSTPVISEELPSTLLWHDGWLYTAGRGTVRRYKQSRPGGGWDVRETIAQGFCGFHHHQVSGLTIGLDGKLYVTTGDDDNDVEGSDGSRATVLRTGAVFRCNPDGSQMEEFSRGYRNPYRDLCHDAAYNWFHADNDNEDGSKFTGCRLMHVAEGVDYGWRLRDGARCCKPDFGRGAVGGEKPGKLAPMLKTGRGAPAGLLAYHDTYLPERYRGLLFYPDVFRKNVRAYRVAAAGASFAVSHEFEFLKSDDPLFRPCQMTTGPDGALYVVDWRTDSGGAGRLSGDGQHGRIYRITWVGTTDEPGIPTRGMDAWKTLIALPDAELVAALDRPDLTDRVIARKELVRRGEAAHALTRAAFTHTKLTPAGRLAALGVLQCRWSPDVAGLVRGLLADPSADVRRLAADALGGHPDRADLRTRDALAGTLADPAPAVRRAAALALGRQQADGTAGVLAAAWVADDGRDPFLADAYLRGLETLGKPGMDAVLVLARSGDDRSRAKAVTAFAAFRERPAFEALPGLVGDPHLTAAQRAEVVRSASNYQLRPAVSLDPLLAALPADPPVPVQVAVLDVLAVGPIRGERSEAFAVAHLTHPDAGVRLAAARAVEEQRLTSAGPALTKVVEDATRPVADRPAQLRAMRAVADPTMVPALTAVLARTEPPAVLVEALRTLAAASPVAARSAAVAMLDRPDPAVVAEAMSVAGATKDGAIAVGERVLSGKLPRDLLPRATDALSRFRSDPAARELSGKLVMGGLKLASDPKTAADIIAQVAEKGDARRGRDVYRNLNLVSCATCHKLEGVGGSVGPDLTRMWDTQSLPKLLESITDPSKEIKEGYQAFRAAMTDGRVLTGLRVAEEPTAVLMRDAEGREIRLPLADIEAFTTSGQSLMPSDAVSRLSFDQLLDLLAFLKSKDQQEGLRGTVVDAFVAGGFAPNLLAGEAPETGGGDWHRLNADATGRLDVRGTAVGPTAGYVRVFAYSPAAQSGAVEVVADGPVRAWVGGKLVVDRPGPSAGESVTVPLAKGWTPVLVKAVTADPTARLTVRVKGTGVRLAAAAE